MWSVYVLISEGSGRSYTGMSTDVATRIRQHNSRKVKATKAYAPWTLKYVESEIPDSVTARIREKYLKSSAGKCWLKKKLSQ